METLESILMEHPFFAGMKPEHLALVAGCAANVRFNAGEFIIREGGVANEFYLVRHGKVAIEIHVPQSGPVTIQTLGPGEILGWSWLITPYKWRFDGRAQELTRAVVLDGKCLREKLEKDHDLGYEFLKRFAQIVTERLESTRLQLLNVYEQH